MAVHLLSDKSIYRWVHTVTFDERDADGHPLWRYSGWEFLHDQHGQVFDGGRNGAAIRRPATDTPAELPVYCRKEGDSA